MSDRELLEMAAKAAGYLWRGIAQNGTPMLECAPGSDIRCPFDWNPLEDNGQALQLAVTLGIFIEIDTCDDCTRIGESGCDTMLVQMHFDGGSEAATRRAIVRAAAEIGKAMP